MDAIIPVTTYFFYMEIQCDFESARHKKRVFLSDKYIVLTVLVLAYIAEQQCNSTNRGTRGSKARINISMSGRPSGLLGFLYYVHTIGADSLVYQQGGN